MTCSTIDVRPAARRPAFAAAVIAVELSLSACGDSTDSASEPPSAVGEAASESPTQDQQATEELTTEEAAEEEVPEEEVPEEPTEEPLAADHLIPFHTGTTTRPEGRNYRPGDCFMVLDPSEDVWPCTRDHDAEVFYTYDLPPSEGEGARDDSAYQSHE